jgi:hypothetical protein
VDPDTLNGDPVCFLPMKPPRSRNALSWLTAEPSFARLGEQAARLAALEADVRRALPGLALTVVAFEHKHIADLSQQVEHPGLKDALARLAARHTG